MADYDLAIIGGGLNGVSIARDAAGRGLRVILLEQARWRFLSESQARRLVAAYGTRIGAVLGDAQSRDDPALASAMT